jgi:hypothetical protein
VEVDRASLRAVARSNRTLHGVKWRQLVVAALGVALLAGCANAEYTTTKAVRDMTRLGVSQDAASCVVRELRSFYSKQYVNAQRAEVARRGLDPNQAAVNPQAVDLYVRNKLAGVDRVGNDEKTMARNVARQCGVPGA